MYWSLATACPAVDLIWMGDSVVEPDVGHRSDPVLGADLVVTVVDGDCSVRLQGPLTHRKTYEHRAGAEYLGVRFRAGASEATVGAQLADLRNDAVSLSAIAGMAVGGLTDELSGARSLRGRAAILRRRVEALWTDAPAPPPLIDATLGLFRTTVGGIGVRDVADAIGVSERHLQRSFRHHVGVSPKLAGRIVRVERLVGQIRSGVPLDLAGLASSVGFYDQAHMTNEVQAVLGTTPGALLVEAHRNDPISSR